MVDLVPGVSGGTLAFAFGIWDRLLHVVSQILTLLRMLLNLRFRESVILIKSMDWTLVIPTGVGILCALLLGAVLIGELLDSQEEVMRAFFFGMVVGGATFPFRSMRHRDSRSLIFFLFGVAVSFVLAGLPPRELEDPAIWFIFLGAAVSICATIVPGLSGSFVLLIFGLYEVFIDALRNRDVVVWLAFALGAWVGTLSFAHLIRWLLNKYRDLVIATLLGLMLGGLRALWPWLGSNRELEWVSDYSELTLPLVWAVVGLGFSLLLTRLPRADEEKDV